MSYIALYRKWRPTTFSDVVGQKQVSDTLSRAIREGKVAHAYLFAGPRGTGKTSMAKIFARALECEHGPTDTPCNECDACRQIIAGAAIDVIEIDAASNRGIDEVRKLRDKTMYLPTELRKKIFIIDEAHMLTTEAWNALLKTVEEPPEHVMFIFATTEAEKLPVTILSRCQRYTFRRITADDIVERLTEVAAAEGIDIDPAARRLIAVQADGGLRDALSLLDQCAGVTDGIVDVTHVESMIGSVGRDWLVRFVEDIERGDGAATLLSLKYALDEGRDIRRILDALVEHFRALLLARVLPASDELAVYDGCRAAFDAQAGTLNAADINAYVRSLQEIRSDAKRTDNPRTVIETGLLVLCAERESGETPSLSRRVQPSKKMTMLHEAPERTAMPTAVSERLIVDEEADEDVGHASSLVRVRAEPVAASEANDGMSSPTENARQQGDVAASYAPGLLPPPRKESVPPVRAAERPRSSEERIETYGTTSTGRPADIGAGIMPPGEYGRIAGDVIKWLNKHKNAMPAAILQSGNLIYIDADKAVVALNSSFNVSMIEREPFRTEVCDAFRAATGRSEVRVECVGAKTPEEASYRQAAQRAGESLAVAPAADAVKTGSSMPAAKAETPALLTDAMKEDVVAQALRNISATHDIRVDGDEPDAVEADMTPYEYVATMEDDEDEKEEFSDWE